MACSTPRCEARPGAISIGPDAGDAVVSLWNLVAWLPALLGLSAADEGERRQATSVRRIVIQDEVIVRIPLGPAPPPAIEWIESKGPKCVPVAAIRGAALSGADHVDFLMADHSRLRAKFDDDCPALDFYGGFYLSPEDGGKLCAKRDSVHSRIGGSCRIERFRRLEPRVKK